MKAFYFLLLLVISGESLSTEHQVQKIACNPSQQLAVAKDFVESRFCGRDFQDDRVVYRQAEIKELMTKLREPVIPGHFILGWDAAVVSRNMHIKKYETVAGGTHFTFAYERLATQEGGMGSNVDAFTVFVPDPKQDDTFVVNVSNSCEIIDPPLTRVHPRAIYNELNTSLQSLKRTLGERCEKVPNCKIVQLQTTSLQKLWGNFLNEECRVTNDMERRKTGTR